MVYPLLTIIFGPCIGSFLSSMRSSYKHRDTAHGTKSLLSYGENTGYSSKGPRSNPLTNVTFSESEERIVKEGGDVRMQDMDAANRAMSPNAIVVSKHVSVTTEDRKSGKSSDGFHQV